MHEFDFVFINANNNENSPKKNKTRAKHNKNYSHRISTSKHHKKVKNKEIGEVLARAIVHWKCYICLYGFAINGRSINANAYVRVRVESELTPVRTMRTYMNEHTQC